MMQSIGRELISTQLATHKWRLTRRKKLTS